MKMMQELSFFLSLFLSDYSSSELEELELLLLP